MVQFSIESPVNSHLRLRPKCFLWKFDCMCWLRLLLHKLLFTLVLHSRHFKILDLRKVGEFVRKAKRLQSIGGRRWLIRMRRDWVLWKRWWRRGVWTPRCLRLKLAGPGLLLSRRRKRVDIWCSSYLMFIICINAIFHINLKKSQRSHLPIISASSLSPFSRLIHPLPLLPYLYILHSFDPLKSLFKYGFFL